MTLNFQISPLEHDFKSSPFYLDTTLKMRLIQLKYDHEFIARPPRYDREVLRFARRWPQISLYELSLCSIRDGFQSNKSVLICLQTFPSIKRPNLSVLVRLHMAYASPSCKDMIWAYSTETNLLKSSLGTCNIRKHYS